MKRLVVLFSGDPEYITCPICGATQYTLLVLELCNADINCNHCGALLKVTGGD